MALSLFQICAANLLLSLCCAPVFAETAVKLSELECSAPNEHYHRNHCSSSGQPFSGVAERKNQANVLIHQAVYRNGKLHGVIKDWFPSGQLQLQTRYAEGVLNGTQQRWHPNGQNAERVGYKNGLRQGKSRSWFNTGARKHSSKYSNGQLQGTITEWYVSGSKKSARSFVNGVQAGQSTEWYENGQPSKQELWTSGGGHLRP